VGATHYPKMQVLGVEPQKLQTLH